MEKLVMLKIFVLPIRSGLAQRWLQWTLPIICSSLSFLSSASAQTVMSGSTGADGNLVVPPNSSNYRIPMPETGVFNYVNISIPSSSTVFFDRNSRNTPVTILVSGNVTLAGTISVSGAPRASGQSIIGGLGGPGGFDGGRGGNAAAGALSGSTGDGPGGGGGGKSTGTNAGGGGGGGFLTPGQNGGSSDLSLIGSGGGRYGTKTLMPLIGGSGGGGSATDPSSGAANTSVGGGGGGGAILIVCDGTINFTGGIDAQGGGGTLTAFFGGTGKGSGGGAGGAIRVIATNIIGGSPVLSVQGGGGGSGFGAVATGGNGGHGYVTVEAYQFTSFNPTVNPSAAYLKLGTPTAFSLANPPQLKIKMVAGANAPATPKGTFAAIPDISFDTAPANPVMVMIEAANIPLGTKVKVILTPESGTSQTVESTPLAGTVAVSTATASLSLTLGRSLINATAVYEINGNIAYLAPDILKGERVKWVRISANFGGQSEVQYITESGKRFRPESE